MQIDYLFSEICRRKQKEGSRPHAHDFWQLDLVQDGAFVNTVNGQDYHCTAQTLLLIPPQHQHSLACSAPQGRALLVKFQVSDISISTPRYRQRHGILKHGSELILDLIKDPALPLSYAQIGQLNMALQILLQEIVHNEEPSAGGPRLSLANRIDDYLRKRDGGYVTVEELAGHLGYSVSHIRRKFREEHSETCKEHLDRRRAEMIERLLLYSELTIAEIADHMEFPGLPAFSRYVKRHLGMPPREVRRQSTIID